MDFKQKLSENTLLGSGELSRPKRNIVDTHEADGSQNLTPQQREYYHKLLSMLASREGFGERVSTAEEDTDFIDDDDENEPIELGYYGSNPYTSDEMAERRPKTKQSRKSKVFTDTNGRYKSSPSLDNSWDEPVEIHRHSEENRSRIPARVVPVHGVYRYHVVGSNREYSPFERRVFTNPVQTLAKRNTKYFF